jgi:hypothetical protein
MLAHPFLHQSNIETNYAQDLYTLNPLLFVHGGFNDHKRQTPALHLSSHDTQLILLSIKHR